MCIENCPNSTWPNPSNNICDACHLTCETCTGGTHEDCVTCPNGSYKMWAGS